MKERIVLYYGISTPLELIRQRTMQVPSYFEAREAVEALYDYCKMTGDAEVEEWIQEIRRHHHYRVPISLLGANENNLPPRMPQNTPMMKKFCTVVINSAQADKVIALLHQLMDGKSKPKDVMMPVRAAMEAGVIRRPTWEEFREEFPDAVKQKSSFSTYTNPVENPYDDGAFRRTVEEFRSVKPEE